MDAYLPKKVTEVNNFTRWCNKVVEWMTRNELHSSSDVLVHKTSGGITLSIIKKPTPQVKETTTTSTSGLVPRGVYIVGNKYQVNELVVYNGGASAGSYYSIIPDNANLPNTGIGWIQLSYGGTNNLGAWT